MPYEIKWLIPNEIILERFYGVFTAEEVEAADMQIIALLEGSPRETIHTIVDDADIEQMPPITALSKLKSARHDKLGWTIIYGQKNLGLRFTTTLANKILRFKVMVVDDFEGAIAKIRQLDPSVTGVVAK